VSAVQNRHRTVQYLHRYHPALYGLIKLNLSDEKEMYSLRRLARYLLYPVATGIIPDYNHKEAAK
jgi:hypothetical protein